MLDHWNKPLSRPLASGDGRALTTLLEAATYLVSSGRNSLRDEPVLVTRDFLMRAATTGLEVDIDQATKQLETFLAGRRP
jgi:hypothetical protein